MPRVRALRSCCVRGYESYRERLTSQATSNSTSEQTEASSPNTTRSNVGTCK